MHLFERINSQVDLEVLRKILWAAALFPICLIPIDGWRVLYSVHHASPETSEENLGSLPIQQGESFDDYQKSLSGKNLFGDFSNAASPLAKTSIAELIKDFRLKGVVITGEKEAILENAKTQQTQFVHKGEQVGELMIEEIQEGFIELRHGGEKSKLEMS